MNKWASFIIMFLAAMPLPFINQIKSQHPLEFSPSFIGEFLGLILGVMVVGIIVGCVLWITIRLIAGRERVLKIQYFATATTVVLALFLLIGNVGTITQANKSSYTPTTEQSRLASKPSYNTEGWTQESTNNTLVGPWLKYSPPGTRYYRDANRIIYRVYPPGVRPNAEKANPFGLGDSTDVPQ